MEDNTNIIYCWRYEDQLIAKIGASIFNKFYDNSIKPALRFSVLDIEILGICLCGSKQTCRELEGHLLNERFDRVRSDREFVYLNNEVHDWINHNCLERNWTVDFFRGLDNEYKEDHRERNREYQREKRQEETLKTRARNMYNEYSEEPKSGLVIGGPVLARVVVAEDLERHGVEASRIDEWLTEIEDRRNQPPHHDKN